MYNTKIKAEVIKYCEENGYLSASCPSMNSVYELIMGFASQLKPSVNVEVVPTKDDINKVFPTHNENSGEDDNAEGLNHVNAFRQEGANWGIDHMLSLLAEKEKQLQFEKENASNYAQKADHYRNTITELRKEKINLQSELEAAQKELGEFSIESISDMKKMTALEIELEAVKKEMDNLKGRFKETHKQIEIYQNKNRELKSSAAQIEKQMCMNCQDRILNK